MKLKEILFYWFCFFLMMSCIQHSSDNTNKIAYQKPEIKAIENVKLDSFLNVLNNSNIFAVYLRE